MYQHTRDTDWGYKIGWDEDKGRLKMKQTETYFLSVCVSTLDLTCVTAALPVGAAQQKSLSRASIRLASIRPVALSYAPRLPNSLLNKANCLLKAHFVLYSTHSAMIQIRTAALWFRTWRGEKRPVIRHIGVNEEFSYIFEIVCSWYEGCWQLEVQHELNQTGKSELGH